MKLTRRISNDLAVALSMVREHPCSGIIAHWTRQSEMLRMKQLMQRAATRIAVAIQAASANVDLEVLSLPGGSVFAVVLWLYATAVTGSQCPMIATEAKGLRAVKRLRPAVQQKVRAPARTLESAEERGAMDPGQ
jgi:hypothetical protein